MIHPPAPHFSTLLLLLGWLSLAPALAQNTSPGSASTPPGKATESGQLAQDIASAGRLRTQAQRLSKLNQQAITGIQATQTSQQIQQSSDQIDHELSRLARYAKKLGTQRIYKRCETLWQEMHAVLNTSAGTPAGNERINQLADELMLHAGKLSMQIEAEAETPVGRLLDLSSRLNMLSQRLARLYLQTQSAGQSAGLLVDIEQARREFAAGLSELDTARENTQASREAISLAKNQWIFFEIAIGQLKQSNRQDGKAALNVVSSSERIAQVLDQASRQYVRDYSASMRN